MSITPSNMLPLGTKAPNFSLTDTISNSVVDLEDKKSKIATVIFFICNHCPFVIHIQSALVKIANKYQKKGISFIAISSNNIDAYPQDNPEKMKIEAENAGYSFPYLFDETQNIAHAYQAACTPDFFIFDENLTCVYRGRFDDSTPGNNKPVTGKDISNALDAIIDKKPVNNNQLPSVGCNIKWKD